MSIHLDPKYEQPLKDLAAVTGKTVDQVVENFVKKALSETMQRDNSQIAESQRRAIKKLQKELDSLPNENPDDGFDASQHDKVIYRRDW